MRLNAPSQLLFIISLIITIVGLLGYFGHLGHGGVFGIHSFWVAFAGWATITAGCFFKGM